MARRGGFLPHTPAGEARKGKSAFRETETVKKAIIYLTLMRQKAYTNYI